MKKTFVIHEGALDKMFILSFSISFDCIEVILLILCVIPLWYSATAHSPSGKELNPSSQEESCFVGLFVLLMFSYDPTWALFGLVLTHITH